MQETMMLHCSRLVCTFIKFSNPNFAFQNWITQLQLSAHIPSHLIWKLCITQTVAELKKAPNTQVFKIQLNFKKQLSYWHLLDMGLVIANSVLCTSYFGSKYTCNTTPVHLVSQRYLFIISQFIQNQHNDQLSWACQLSWQSTTPVLQRSWVQIPYWPEFFSGFLFTVA